MTRASLLRALACLAAVALPSAGSAYTPSESKWNPSTLPISYRVNTSSAPSTLGASGALAAVQGGFASWAAPVCSAWRTTYAGTSSLARANQRDRSNDILWISGAWPAELGSVNVTIGVTTPVWTVGGYFFDADIQFNNVGFTWSMGGAGRTVDAQSIATHEEGHFLGLDHSPLSSAVMYASYAGGDRSRLSSDDIAGVCFLYPSGMAVPDAGTTTPDAGGSADPCSRYTSCAGCTPVNNCGWCGATGQCVTSRSTGPVAGACASGFAWTSDMCTATPVRDAGTVAPTDVGSTTDPCDRYSASCGACTPIGGCGWCGATNRCMYGTSSGPRLSACATGWAWNTTDCAASMGTASFGEPCTRTTDCASGGPCVAVRTSSSPFCTRACVDDCSCPRGYSCSGTLSSGQVVCVPGTNRCAADAGAVPPVDAGVAPVDVPVTPRDVPVTSRDVVTAADAQEPPMDSGEVMPTDDAGAKTRDDAAADAGNNGFMPLPEQTGCGCRTTTPTQTGGGSAALFALSLFALRYRRRARRLV